MGGYRPRTSLQAGTEVDLRAGILRFGKWTARCAGRSGSVRSGAGGRCAERRGRPAECSMNSCSRLAGTHDLAMQQEPLLQLELPGIQKLKSGKVREIFDLGDCLLLVATDRISAFDCLMPNGIPRKGEILTQLSHFWFERFRPLVPNHLLVRANEPLPAILKPFAQTVARRSMVVKKAAPLTIECVVRGYLAGSGWKE